jgi:hypothetical protein
MGLRTRFWPCTSREGLNLFNFRKTAGLKSGRVWKTSPIAERHAKMAQALDGLIFLVIESEAPGMRRSQGEAMAARRSISRKQWRMDMRSIANHPMYDLKVEESRNRLYLKLMGFWKDKAGVPKYETDLFTGIKALKKGFSMVVDVREMKAPTPEVGQWIEELQKKIVAAGLDKNAEIHASALFKLAAQRYANSSNMKVKAFEKIEDAEKWLDG